MKVIILAGGMGTRLGEITEIVPKPMVLIGKQPILWHIMSIYSSYGFNEFIIALGYKSEVIKKYFLDYKFNNNDFSIDLNTGDITFLNNNNKNWKVSLIFTGKESNTGGRLKRLSNLIGNNRFMFTYGDGLADIDINKLIKFHEENQKIVTVSAVRPNARFGELLIEDNFVSKFSEKPQTKDGWINGGFFVCEPEVFNFIQDDQSSFERDSLEYLCKENELAAFKHRGFWQCMDTKRDRDYLISQWKNGKVEWAKNWKIDE